MGGDYLDIKDGVGTGNKFAVSYYQKQAEEQRYRDLGEGTRDFNTLTFDQYAKLNNIRMGAEASDDFGSDGTPEENLAAYNKAMAEMAATASFKTSLSTKRTLRGDDGKVISESGQTIVIKGGNVQGDTVNQMSQTNVTGPLEVNNTEMTQKIIQEHF